jgi:hypothetical protein
MSSRQHKLMINQGCSTFVNPLLVSVLIPAGGWGVMSQADHPLPPVGDAGSNCNSESKLIWADSAHRTYNQLKAFLWLSLLNYIHTSCCSQICPGFLIWQTSDRKLLVSVSVSAKISVSVWISVSVSVSFNLSVSAEILVQHWTENRNLYLSLFRCISASLPSLSR